MIPGSDATVLLSEVEEGRLKAAVLRWMGDDPPDRRPKTKQQLATTLGVTRSIVNHLMQLLFADGSLTKLLHNKAGAHLEPVLRQLVDQAEAGDLQAIKIYLQHFKPILSDFMGETGSVTGPTIILQIGDQFQPKRIEMIAAKQLSAPV